MIDILFLAHNRLEFTYASLDALLENTDFRRVNRLWLYDDGSTDGTREYLKDFAPAKEDTHFIGTNLSSPVAVMSHFLSLKGGGAPLFAKIDNDVIVPPGWLDQCLKTMEAFPELDLLGIEPPDSRKPHFTLPMRRQETHDQEIMPGLCGYVLCDAVGGIGVFRRRAFNNRHLVPNGPHGGFNDWQARYPEVRRGWIRPALKLFLLDRLPIEPWKSLSEQYISMGWQRKWRDYELTDSHLWDWWAKVESCSA